MPQLYAFFPFYLLHYLLVFLFATAATPSQAQYKVMVLGNSITQGNAENPGYRYELWKMLLDKGVDVELVGSHDVNEGGDPAEKGTVYKGKTYTNRNEGHWGWTADEVLNGKDGEGKLTEWLQGYSPDIVLLHLGTNDMFRQCGAPACYQQTIDELKQVVAQIRQKNPEAVFYIAKLIPAYDQKVGTQSAANIRELNERIPAMVQELSTAVSPVHLVDQYSGFDPTTGQDTHDGVHPNASGERKMAQQWYAAMEPMFTTLPVALHAFRASSTALGHVLLRWQTASETNNAAFEVERSADGKTFAKIGEVQGAGTTHSARTYTFEDTLTVNGTVYYRLRQLDHDGSSQYSTIISTEKIAGRKKLRVYPTSPNSGQHVTVHLQHHPPQSEVEISIYTSAGKLVKQFRESVSSGGSLVAHIKLHDLLGAGLYLVHVASADHQLQGKFLLSE